MAVGGPRWGRIRWTRVGWAVGGTVLVVAVATTLEYAIRALDNGHIGVDYDLYMFATRRWLAGGPFYHPYQLVWPYPPITSEDQMPVLYPPTMLYLFAPFTYLPAILWWLLPIALTLIGLVRLRPHPAGWLGVVALAALPNTREPYLWGNPLMWFVATETWGLFLGWPAALVLLKPSLGPFALIGVTTRSWWAAIALMGALSLPFAAMWLDWVAAVRNAGVTPAYSVAQIPPMLIPLVAWIASPRTRAALMARFASPARSAATPLDAHATPLQPEGSRAGT